MKIIDLRDAPQHLDTLAQWFFDEWGYLHPGQTLAEYRLGMNGYLSAAPIPKLLIALEDDAVVGSAALIAADMETHPELTPWLANVYVREDCRGRGLGRTLVRAIMAYARNTDALPLYLFTPDQSAFYERLGWSLMSEENYQDVRVSIMQLPH